MPITSPRCELRPFFGSHARTSHVQFKVRTHTCAHVQFEVVALRTRTRTFGKVTFFQYFFSKFSVCFQQFFSKFSTFWGILKQERRFRSRKGCSKTGQDVLEQHFLAILFQKCAKVRSHIARPKTSRTHAHPAHFFEWILHAHAHVRPHIARVRARTHLRISYLATDYIPSPFLCYKTEDCDIIMFLRMVPNQKYPLQSVKFFSTVVILFTGSSMYMFYFFLKKCKVYFEVKHTKNAGSRVENLKQ